MRPKSIGAVYLLIGLAFAAFVAVLAALLWRTPVPMREAPALIQPMLALVALTAVVWLMMVVYRNVATIRRQATLRYFQAYLSDAPAEWIERPARAYMNLLELPVLFYVACLLMLTTGRFDSVQVSLAWVFVAVRCMHAIIHIGFNYVPLRFAAFLCGAITLAVMWLRLAEQNLA